MANRTKAANTAKRTWIGEIIAGVILVLVLLGIFVWHEQKGKGAVAAPRCPARYAAIDGQKVRIPVEPGCVRINSSVATGNQVIIGPSNVYPMHLFAQPHQTITFTNLTSTDQSVTFEASTVHSGTIRPGETWTWTPATGISIRYAASNGSYGILDVGALP